MNSTNPTPAPHDVIGENIDSIAAYYQQKTADVSRTQAAIETTSKLFGSVGYLLGLLLFVALWVGVNIYVERHDMQAFDPLPFVLLQGLLGLNGVLITIAILIRQNRMLTLEEKRAHLELQVTLIAEQKTTKIIQLLEELRNDLPSVRDRDDPHTQSLAVPTDPNVVLEKLDSVSLDIAHSKNN